MEYKKTEKITKEILKEILRIKGKTGLTAESIVMEAKKKNNPLHNFFEWDDDTAGEKWRLQQARVLINEVKIIIEDKEYYAFENVRISIGDVDGNREYVSRDEILTNEDLRQQIIEKALNYLKYWKQQYENYIEFKVVVNAIKETESKIKSKKKIRVNTLDVKEKAVA